MFKVFSNIPFLRIMIPFIIGIMFGISFKLQATFIIPGIVILMLAAALWFLPKQNHTIKHGFLMCMDLFLFILAIQLVNTNNLTKQNNYYANYIKKDSIDFLTVTINDIPVEKDKFIKCYLNVNEVNKNSLYIKTKGNIIAYFKRSNKDKLLIPGATLIVKTKLLEVEAPKNPYEFDYKNYLYNKHIYHTAFIEKEAFEVVDIPVQLNPVWYFGLKAKKYVLHALKNGGLSDVSYGICAALLTGYDDEIDKQVIESFSHSGTLHVLSVSGLHTGLIYLVLSFIFDLIDKKRKYKITKFVLITVLLWAFALITGFSPPVLRAVIMFNLMGFGKIFFRANNKVQTNLLLVSAFILLSYDPYFITDIGFLLSYFAVFGLIYFQPKFTLLWQPGNRISKWLWEGTTASFAATLSTLPLTLFYFKQFPLWFFVCNIVVVPVSFILLLLAILVVLKTGFAATLINYTTIYLVKFITLFNSNKFGYIDSIDFNFYDTLFFSLLILFITIAFKNRSYKIMVTSVILIIAWQIVSLVSSYASKTKNVLAVYQVNKKNMVMIKNKDHATINVLDSSTFLFHVKPHLVSFNNSSFSINNFNYIQKDKKTFLILSKKGCWPNIETDKINNLILANNFKLTEKDLDVLCNLKTVIADGSNSNYSIKKTEELCRKFGIQLVKTKQAGAYILNL